MYSNQSIFSRSKEKTTDLYENWWTRGLVPLHTTKSVNSCFFKSTASRNNPITVFNQNVSHHQPPGLKLQQERKCYFMA